MLFYEKIKTLRTEKGLYQRELADLLKTSNSTICDWERGRCEPSIQDLIKLSNVFNCSVDYLIGNEDDFGVINSKPGAVSFTREQSELLAVFDLLPVEQQREVIGFAKALAY